MDEIDYEIYLSSSEWKVVRRIALTFCNYRCQLCNNRKNLQVHHRTYENIGSETLRDVVVLCEKCHDFFHKRLTGSEKEYRVGLNQEEKISYFDQDAPISEDNSLSKERTIEELKDDFKDIIQDRDDIKGRKGVNRVFVRNLMISLNIDLKYHTILCDILDEDEIEDVDDCVDRILSKQ